MATFRATGNRFSRRRFLQTAAASATAAGALHATPARADGKSSLRVGYAEIDITPPMDAELAGFHRPVGKERRATSVRQTPLLRTMVVQEGATRAAIVSLDVLAADRVMTERVQQAVERATGIPAGHVRLCATHTHTMPSFRYLRQWGAIHAAYRDEVEKKIVDSVGKARADLAEAQLRVGKSRAEGGGFNRTRKPWKTDLQFTAQSSYTDRWVDSTLTALRVIRSGKPDLVWYNFSAHPVCYRDEAAGPDWPGLVAKQIEAERGCKVSFLQGHSGDVNPGDGAKWIGDAEPTVSRVVPALKQALDAAQPAPGGPLAVTAKSIALPLDVARFLQWLDEYRRAPEKCVKGVWVDAGFAADWFAAASKLSEPPKTLSVPVAAMRLGPIGMVFHPSELYSYYGLLIRRRSPAPQTMVVGYTADFIGYLPDPDAFRDSEYSAIVVPKIVDLPPFAPEAASVLADELSAMLRQLWA